MTLMLILCHPQVRSLNYSVAKQVLEVAEELEHTIYFHDLYREAFNPVLSDEEIRRGFSFDEQVQKYTVELESAEGLILIHPDWWGQPPGLLKGWVDRVFRPGVAYTFEGQEFMKKQQVPLLRGKRALIFASTDSEDKGSPHLLENLWQKGVFTYCAENPLFTEPLAEKRPYPLMGLF
ncbi:hypothetical protein LCGC14_2372330 [marine sediment metagenome]|uniref:Flavodoxin-like fold domain-containing protein n=1 Tax=marine sediment metagenome TaxID=412755 RepID=A0A0F9EFW4_9ZZZZ